MKYMVRIFEKLKIVIKFGGFLNNRWLLIILIFRDVKKSKKKKIVKFNNMF